MNKLAPTTFNLARYGIPFPVVIPAVKDLSIELVAALIEDRLVISKFSEDSSLGHCEYQGTLAPIKNESLNGAVVTGRGSVTLKDEGVTQLGAWISLLSNGRLQPTVRSFSFNVHGAMPHVSIDFSTTEK
jgi:hypothetical protein